MSVLLAAKLTWGVVTLIGIVIEIAGVALMANRYGNFKLWNYPFIFGSVLINGKMARNAAAYARGRNEDFGKTLSGLVLLAMGFMFQLAATIGLMLTT